MASEDKTYCGRGDKEGIDIGPNDINQLAQKLGVASRDILDAMNKVGPDLQKVEDYFHNMENSY